MHGEWQFCIGLSNWYEVVEKVMKSEITILFKAEKTPAFGREPTLSKERLACATLNEVD